MSSMLPTATDVSKQSKAQELILGGAPERNCACNVGNGDRKCVPPDIFQRSANTRVSIYHERGFRCGAEDKVSGPKTWRKPSDDGAQIARGQHMFAIPRTPIPNEAMTSVDMRYWQQISEFQLAKDTRPETKFMLLMREITGRVYGNPMPLTVTVPWPELPLSSKPFRYAARQGMTQIPIL
jgi:hypothetical protein